MRSAIKNGEFEDFRVQFHSQQAKTD